MCAWLVSGLRWSVAPLSTYRHLFFVVIFESETTGITEIPDVWIIIIITNFYYVTLSTANITQRDDVRMNEYATMMVLFRKGEAKVRGEKLFEGHFVHHKSHKDWINVTIIIKLP